MAQAALLIVAGDATTRHALCAGLASAFEVTPAADRVAALLMPIALGAAAYAAWLARDGGVEASGFGRMNGRDGLRSFTNPRAVLDDRFPINPPAKLYPVKDNDYAQVKASVQLVYSRGLRAKLAALKAVFRARRRRRRRGSGSSSGSGAST